MSASKARAKVLLIEEKGFALPVQVMKKSLSDTTEQYSMIVERFKKMHGILSTCQLHTNSGCGKERRI